MVIITIRSLSDLYLGVEKKKFKEIMLFAMHKNPYPGVHEMSMFVDPSRVIIIMRLVYLNPVQSREDFKEIMHFH